MGQVVAIASWQSQAVWSSIYSYVAMHVAVDEFELVFNYACLK